MNYCFSLIVFFYLMAPMNLVAGTKAPLSDPGYRFFQFFYHSGINVGPTKYLQELYTWGSQAYEFRYGLQSRGDEIWQQYHRLPQYGLGFHYADLIVDKADTVIGNPFSMFMFYSAPFARIGKFTFSSDLSVGLSYTNKCYNPLTNPYNDVIGSQINIYFNLNANFRYSISSKANLSFGTGLTHYSNGAIQRPQLGMNTIRLYLGISYKFKYPQARNKIEQNGQLEVFKAEGEAKSDLHVTSYPSFQVMSALGVVEKQKIGEPEGQRFFTSSFTVDYASPITPINNITFGLDVLYDGSQMKSIKGVPPDEVRIAQKMYLGSHIGYQILIHRITLLFNLGSYFRQSSYDSGFWFIRAGGRIRISEHLHTHICIKTKAGFRSDWIEWGIAYHAKIR